MQVLGRQRLGNVGKRIQKDFLNVLAGVNWKVTSEWGPNVV